MALLLAFAFVAGAGTALSPCVLPVLPVALGAGATGGRRRPLGIVTGLALSFTFATVGLVYAVEARLSALGARAGAGGARRGGEGFAGGLVVGVSLGLVYAPCAGPILAGVITVSASQSFTAGRLVTALAYGLGSAVALYALMLLRRPLARPLAPRRG